MLSKAFSLVEIMVVVLIVGLLAALASPHFVRRPEKAIFMDGLAHARAFQLAEKQYFLDHNAYAACADLEVTQRTTKFTFSCDAGTGIVTVARSGGALAYSLLANPAQDLTGNGGVTCPACPADLAVLLR